MTMQTFDDADIEVLPVDGMAIPRIRMTTWGLPEIEIQVGDDLYEYQRSYPIKGHGATLPPAIREQLDAGKQPLIIERLQRFYLYTKK